MTYDIWSKIVFAEIAHMQLISSILDGHTWTNILTSFANWPRYLYST